MLSLQRDARDGLELPLMPAVPCAKFSLRTFGGAKCRCRAKPSKSAACVAKWSKPPLERSKCAKRPLFAASVSAKQHTTLFPSGHKTLACLIPQAAIITPKARFSQRSGLFVSKVSSAAPQSAKNWANSSEEIHKSPEEIHISLADLCISSEELYIPLPDLCISSREIPIFLPEIGIFFFRPSQGAAPSE